MKIELWVIGQTVQKFVSEGEQYYSRKLKPYCKINYKVLKSIKVKSLTQDQVKKREAQIILEKWKSEKGIIIALDEHGKQITSPEFANLIQKKIETFGNIIFLIGGAYGLDSEVLEKAHMNIALSKMTFPHDLVRLIFFEQLYRAFSILNHSPYHHE